MRILTYEIEARTKADPLAVASESDFRLKAGVEGITPVELVSRTSISPYCIVPRTGRVLLTELPEAVDIASTAFVYEAQYRHALRVHSIPLNDLLEMAQDLPAPRPFLLLHSTGRCGSTLLAKALARAGVASLSEPDIFTQLALLGRSDDHEDLDAIRSLYRCFVRLFARGRGEPLAFKLRSISCEHADYMAAALPMAKSLFLYRDAADVARSYARIAGRPVAGWKLTRREMRAWSVLVPLLLERPGRVHGYDLLAALWAGPVRRYLDSLPQPIWLGALNYADLVSRPDAVLAALLNQFGMKVPVDLTSAFSVHSQIGSHLDPQSAILPKHCESELSSAAFAAHLEDSLQAIDPRLSTSMVLPNRFPLLSGI